MGFKGIVMKETASHILNYLTESRFEMIAFLKKLVEYESPSGDPESQLEILGFLKKELEKIDYRTTIYPGRKTGGYLLAVPKERIKGRPIQLLLGHCDTVWKKSTLDEMPLVEEGENISGPGIFDMKAGLTQAVFVLKAIRELELQLRATPVLLINSDEEIGSFESTPAIRRLSRIANRAFVLEPPLGLKGKLKTQRKGIGKFVVTVRGKPAHAGLNPDKGVSAIVELSYQIQHLFALNDFEKGITVNVGMIQGGSSANVIAEESRAVVDVRVNNMADAELIRKEILSLRPKHAESEVIVHGDFGRPPMERTARNNRLWRMAREYGDLLGLHLEETAAGGGSDGNTTSQYTATLDGLGTVGEGAHARHEYIISDTLIERTALLALLVLSDPVKSDPVKDEKGRVEQKKMKVNQKKGG